MILMHQAYFKRLNQDVARWQREGLIDDRAAQKILASAQPKNRPLEFGSILLKLGVFLLLFSALSFVAANWQEMSRLTKMLLLMGVMWAALAGAWFAGERKLPYLREVLLLGAVGMFGINIAYISQIYHIDGRLPDGFFLAGLGGLAVTLLHNSRLALIATWALFGVWSAFEMIQYDVRPHWLFLPFWVLLATLSFIRKDALSLGLAIVTLFIWLGIAHFSTLADLKASPDFIISTTILLILTLMGLSVALSDQFKDLRFKSVLTSLFVLSLAALSIFMLFVQFDPNQVSVSDRPDVSLDWYFYLLFFSSVALGIYIALSDKRDSKYLWMPVIISLWAAARFWLEGSETFALLFSPWLARILALALALWTIYLGKIWHNNWLVNLGIAFFGLHVLFIYFKVFGSLMNTSLFFFIGGLLFLGLGIFLERLRRDALADNQKMNAMKGEEKANV